MITNVDDYLKELWRLQDKNLPTEAILLPSDETIYHINLNTRLIESPSHLSVKTDHLSETVFFSVDRYFDNMDLTQTVCIIQYINQNAVNDYGQPAGGFVYFVPFYDITYYKKQGENKILIPWAVGGPATAAAGPITFSVRFYACNESGTEIIYNLNTIPTESQILDTMAVMTEENENFIIPSTTVEQIFSEIKALRDQSVLTWIEAI